MWQYVLVLDAVVEAHFLSILLRHGVCNLKSSVLVSCIQIHLRLLKISCFTIIRDPEILLLFFSSPIVWRLGALRNPQAISRRAVAVKERAQAVAGFAWGLALFCKDDSDSAASESVRAKAKAAFDKVKMPDLT